MTDARFEDGVDTPLRLRAESAEDLAVISALLQDAVAQVADVAWTPKHRRLAVLVNRFRWEDANAAARERRPFERVRAILAIDGALGVRTNGLDQTDRDMVISLLAVAFEPGEDGTGIVRLTLAGDAEIAVPVECLDVTLADVTRPYAALSGKAPGHPD